MDKIEQFEAQQNIDGLSELLRTRKFFQRLRVIEAFEKIGDPKAIPPLKSLLKDNDSRIRNAASKAIKKISDTGSTIKKQELTSYNSKITSENVENNYKVVPFYQTDDVPTSLQRIIDFETASGWEYMSHQYSDKLKPGNAGCFGIGAVPDSTVHVGFVIFKRMTK